MIAIVDYGVGNLKSIANAFEAIGQKVVVTQRPSEVSAAQGIVLPGVGAFGDGMKSLRATGLIDTLNKEVLLERKPFLGICLGLQLLAGVGLEHGEHQGLDWVDGRVLRLEPDSTEFRVPHIGWNDVRVVRSCPLFENLEDGPVFYFLHSYHFTPAPAQSDSVVATCQHGQTLTAAVQKGNIFGVQFHPEKSQRSGLRILRNWVALLGAT